MRGPGRRRRKWLLRRGQERSTTYWRRACPASPGEVVRRQSLQADSSDALSAVWGLGTEEVKGLTGRERIAKGLTRVVDGGDALDPESLWYTPWEELAVLIEGETNGTELSAAVAATWAEKRGRLASQEVGSPLRWDVLQWDRVTLPETKGLPVLPQGIVWRVVALRRELRPNLGESGLVASLRWEGDVEEAP